MEELNILHQQCAKAGLPILIYGPHATMEMAKGGGGIYTK